VGNSSVLDRSIDRKEYTTDVLFDQAIKTIKTYNSTSDRPFAIVLSIPDPHNPYIVRPPYDNLYQNFTFHIPKTMNISRKGSEIRSPNWINYVKRNSIDYKRWYTCKRQRIMQIYFGMVKLIDDRIGDILSLLQQQGLENNTIVIYTSDHGHLLGEHGRDKKGLPYKASASIPFIIRYPNVISAGVVIHTVHNTVDFTPTILNLMRMSNVNNNMMVSTNNIMSSSYHGEDLSNVWKNPTVINSNNHTRITYITNNLNFAAAVTSRYKLVLSNLDIPWLFDMRRDPDEVINYYGQDTYEEIYHWLVKYLLDQMEKFKDIMVPFLSNQFPIENRSEF